jgi:hypothetical protein
VILCVENGQMRYRLQGIWSLINRWQFYKELPDYVL